MKRIALVLLIFCMIFTACNAKRDTEERSLQGEVARVEQALGSERFLRADEDFAKTNFGDHATGPSAVFFEEDGIGEWGMFVVGDAAKSAALKAELRAYLATQRDAVQSLAELYPGEELQHRLSLYENASVGGDGGLVWYFALEKGDLAIAEQCLQTK